MSTKRFCVVSVILSVILCVPVRGELEAPHSDEPVLLDQPNPVLAGIEELHVLIVPPDGEPNKDGLMWTSLDEIVKLRLKEAGIKIAPVYYSGGKRTNAPGFPIPDIRVCVDMLKLSEPQRYVFYIQTSLASKVSLPKNPQRYIIADVWKVKPVLQAVSAESLSAKVTEVVLGQVENFVNCWLVANPKCVPLDAPNTVSEVPAEGIGAIAKPAAAQYGYVGSKKSRVFHKGGCSSAKRISPENLTGYGSRAEAIDAGKRPCKRCKP